jgi:hypothetical protein
VIQLLFADFTTMLEKEINGLSMTMPGMMTFFFIVEHWVIDDRQSRKTDKTLGLLDLNMPPVIVELIFKLH